VRRELVHVGDAGVRDDPLELAHPVNDTKRKERR
jgi:hypothetical protein